jgi:hypothetical protein
MQRPSKQNNDSLQEDFWRFLIQAVFGFLLGLATEARRAFEAAAASKWVTWWVCTTVLVSPATTWFVKTHWL